MISDCLEISTYKKEIHFIVVAALEIRYVFINRVKLAMAASFDCDLSEHPLARNTK